MKTVTSDEFWVTNCSDLNVSIADLGITIPARANWNLLGKKSNFTLEQCQKSAKEGSLFTKGSIIKVREVAPPDSPVKPGLYKVNCMMVPTRYKLWSQLKIVEQQFDELNMSEEEFVGEMVDSEEKK